MKLHQAIALVAGKKKAAADVVTAAYHTIQKNAQFDGLSRTYQPKDEEGEKLPPENKAVQSKVSDLIANARAGWTDEWDAVATQEYANASGNAKADVVVDGVTVLTGVPALVLLYLEKQINDVTTFIGKLPTLDQGDTWQYNEATDTYVTPPVETTRTKKTPKAFVKYEATKEHPAQVETFHEDVLVGYWKMVKFSGAIPAKRRNELLERARKLKEAIVLAREQANTAEATPVSLGKPVLDYLFQK